MTSTQLIYLLTTAVAVSLDSFFAGFAVGYKSGKNFTLPIAAALLTLMCCIATSLPTMLIKQYIQPDILNQIGACILLTVGLLNIVADNDNCNIKNKSQLRQCIAIGFAVALDASVACASLTVMNYPPVTVSLVFATMHLITVSLGQQLARIRRLATVFAKLDWLGGCMLIALAVTKCL